MNKKRIGASVLAAGMLVLSCLGGCTKSLSTAELAEAYQKAVDNSLKADIYYFKENKNSGSDNDYRQVNVNVPQDKHYEVKRDENGDYAEVRVEVLENHNSKTIIKRVCGLSKGTGKNDEQKPYLFLTEYTDGKESNHTKTPMTGKEYYNSEAFRPYTLETMLQELTELTVDDMDFSIKGGGSVKKSNVTNLTFRVKDEYLKRYQEKHGKPSLFAGTKKASIEFAYDRVSNIITYMDEQVDKGISTEIEKYKLEVVYLGPTVNIPSYNAKDADGKPVWKDA